MKRLTGLVCLLLAGCVTPDAATPPVSSSSATSPSAISMKQKIDAAMSGWLEEYNVPAAAVAYIENNKVAWAASYGEQAPSVPANDETLFNIASMAKPIAAETVLRLAAQGEVDLDEPMSAYWIDPDIKDDARHALLTPRLALTHRTGFPNWRYQTDDVLTFQFEPGAKTSYSGEGYNYVGRFLEKKFQTPFEDLVEANVYAPNAMTRTSFTKRDWFEGRLTRPHNKDGETRDPTVRDDWNAADDVYTTPRDYADFMASVMRNEGVSDHVAAIRHQAMENQFADGCRFPPAICPVSIGYGLGWAEFEYENETVVLQGGADWGERTTGFFVPERGIGVIVFTNSANGSKVIRDVAQILYPDNAAFIGFLNLQAQ